jgi:hypothetical protein
MAGQIATFDKQRLKSRPATLSHDDICAVERAICVKWASRRPEPCPPTEKGSNRRAAPWNSAT